MAVVLVVLVLVIVVLVLGSCHGRAVPDEGLQLVHGVVEGGERLGRRLTGAAPCSADGVEECPPGPLLGGPQGLRASDQDRCAAARTA